MNIVVVSSLTGVATANYLVSAFRRTAHTVLAVSDVPGYAADIVCGPAPDVAGICATRGLTPNLALFVEGGSMQLFPTGLERLPCPTAWHAIDTHTDYAKHVRIARLFDVTFVAQKEFVTRLQDDTGRPVEWLPLAFPTEHLTAEPAERTIDIAFVGAADGDAYPERARLLGLLKANAPSHSIGRATPAEMLQRYANAKVVFNQSAANDVNMRYFEAMGSGAVLLTDVTVGNGVEDLFEPGRHMVQYRDEHELVAAFRELLSDPRRCAAIGRAARELVLQQHTYDHRAAQILGRMGEAKKSVFPQPPEYIAVFGALNMPAEALHAAAAEFAAMGIRSRLAPVNRGIGQVLKAIALLLRAATRLVRLVQRR